MSSYLKKKYFAFVFFAFFTTTLSAAMDLKAYKELQKSSKDMVKIYIYGVGEGYSWSNTILQDRGGKALFCVPKNMALNAENYISITNNRIASLGGSAVAEMPIELILYSGLIETFPCVD